MRALREAATFQITEHGLYAGIGGVGGADNAFCVLSVTHEVANNLGAEAAQILKAHELAQGSYRNRFTAAPADARIVPEPLGLPTAPGLQTAIVRAAPGEPLTTDRDGRVRVQFGWQRGAVYQLSKNYHVLNFNCTTISLDGARAGVPTFEDGGSMFIDPGAVMTSAEIFAMKTVGGGTSGRLFLPANLQNYLSTKPAVRPIRVDIYGARK